MVPFRKVEKKNRCILMIPPLPFLFELNEQIILYSVSGVAATYREVSLSETAGLPSVCGKDDEVGRKFDGLNRRSRTLTWL
jgi:hypothetical protein